MGEATITEQPFQAVDRLQLRNTVFSSLGLATITEHSLLKLGIGYNYGTQQQACDRLQLQNSLWSMG